MPAPMDEETMRSLAKRRLETEVANLSDSKASKNESEANSKTKKKEDLSKKLPHIVIDSYCMLSNAVFMNRLITSKTAVIVVPRKGKGTYTFNVINTIHILSLLVACQ